MEEVTSNMTIAVIMVYLACHEGEKKQKTKATHSKNERQVVFELGLERDAFHLGISYYY